MGSQRDTTGPPNNVKSKGEGEDLDVAGSSACGLPREGAGPGLPCSDPRGGEEENVLLDTLGPLLGPREG